MRIAVTLAIIARYLNRYIFHPTYIFDVESGVREELLRLAVVHSKKESFIRALLLSLFPDEQEELATERINSFREQVMWHVEELLAAPIAATFASELEEFARSAYETWATVRAATERYEPTFKPEEIEGFEWETFQFDMAIPDENTERTAIHGGRDDELLVIFPQLYTVWNNQQPNLIADGTVLRRSQSLVAAQEVEGQKSNPTFGTTALKRQTTRKMSSALAPPISSDENSNFEDRSFLE
jgi:hypothetical protein